MKKARKLPDAIRIMSFGETNINRLKMRQFEH